MIFRRPRGKPVVLSAGFAGASHPFVSYDGRRVLFVARKTDAQPSQVFEVALPDGRPRQLTKGGVDCALPLYLAEGRPAFAKPADGNWSLFTVDASGEKQALTFSPLDEFAPCLLDTGALVYLSSDGMSPERLALNAVNADGTQPRRLAELPPVESQPTGVRQVGDKAVVDFVEGASLELSLATPSLGFTERGEAAPTSVAVSPRQRPPAHPSIIDSTCEYGALFCVDARFASPTDDEALASVTGMRVDTPQGELGVLDLEPDGSFHVEVPPDVPLRLTLLNSQGAEIGRPCQWIWARPKESNGCVGCHVKPEIVPDDVVPMATEKPAVSLVGKDVERKEEFVDHE